MTPKADDFFTCYLCGVTLIKGFDVTRQLCPKCWRVTMVELVERSKNHSA